MVSTSPRDPAATRARILVAATREFARHGIGGARVDRLARAAKANKRMLYYYFGDKDGLFRAVLENAYAGIRSAEHDLNLLALSPIDGVRRLVGFTWAYFLEHPEFLTLLNTENLHRGRHLKRAKTLQAINSPIIEMLAELLRRGERTGELRRGVDALQLYISIAGMCAFYLSNNYTLSSVFDRDLRDPAHRPARLAHMEDLVLGYVTNREKTPVTRVVNRPVKIA